MCVISVMLFFNGKFKMDEDAFKKVLKYIDYVKGKPSVLTRPLISLNMVRAG